MKSKFTKLFILITGAALIFASCKKSSNSTSGSNPQTPKQVSGFIALNITSSLFSSTGVNLSSGTDAPSALAVHTKGKVLNDLNDPQCGDVVDTTFNFSIMQNDTSLSVTGPIKFAFTCANGVLNGFMLTENLNIKIATPQLAATNTTSEGITLIVLDPTNDSSKFTLAGTLNSASTLAYKTTTAGKSGSSTFDYKMSTLTIDPNNDGDILSGSASFTTSGTGASGTWSYTGTIVFLGNHMAKVTINGFAYTVNTETGVVS